MTDDIQGLFCSVGTDPRIDDPHVELTFEVRSDKFSMTLRPKEAIALAELLQRLAAEAEQEKGPTANN